MTSVLEGVSGQQHAPTALYPRERHGTHHTGGCVGLMVGLDRLGKSRTPPGFDPRTGQQVVIRYTAWDTGPTPNYISDIKTHLNPPDRLYFASKPSVHSTSHTNSTVYIKGMKQKEEWEWKLVGRVLHPHTPPQVTQPVKVKVKQSRYRLGVAQRVPGI
jgi:hypothetical protein